MRKMRSSVRWARVAIVGMALGTLLVGACSSEGDTRVSTASACESYATAWVDIDARCRGNTLSGDLRNEVIQRTKRSCVEVLGMRGVTVSASWVKTCADWMSGASCVNGFGGSPCDLDPPGTLAEGEPCFSGHQCQSQRCSYDQNGALDPTEEDFSCGVCAPKIPIGAHCDNSNYETQCAGDAYCSSDDVCVGLPTLGQSCEGSYMCAGDAVCGENDVCTKRTIVAAGGACEIGAQCAEGTDCIDGICASLPRQGEPCAGEYEKCGPGLDCSSGICAKRVFAPPGAACNEDVSCEVDFCSDWNGGVCPVLLDDGAACDVDDSTQTCKSGSDCRKGICTWVDATICNGG